MAAVARGAQRLQLPDTRPFFGVVPSLQKLEMFRYLDPTVASPAATHPQPFLGFMCLEHAS